MIEDIFDVNNVQLVEKTNHPVAWHSLPEEIVYKKLQSSISGIAREEVEERQREFGLNTLPERKPPTLLEVVFHQLKSPLIYILLIAGIIAIASGDLKDAIFILAVILLNTLIGTVQEYKAEQSAHTLQRLLRVQARIRRSGQQTVIDAIELVPGDVVLLESGDKVPADLRLVQANNLSIDESFLTGESIAANKKTNLLEQEIPVSDRFNMAYAGSTVSSGRGIGLVVATGKYTEVGKIARTVAEEEGAKPPLVLRMEKFSRQISVVVLAFASILGLISFSRGMPFNDVILLVIAMAVSAIPEGLPVAMTVALSLSTSRMAKRNVIVRKLTAVESLGSCTVIASDKTGTLTVNQQTVQLVELNCGTRVSFSGQGYIGEGKYSISHEKGNCSGIEGQLKELGRNAILCNEGSLEKENGEWKHTGDAMDVALLALGYKLGLDPKEIRQNNRTLAEIPFESEKRYAATLSQVVGRKILVAKGAIERILAFCDRMLMPEGYQTLDRQVINDNALSMAEEGYRVLAFASKEITEEINPEELDESILTSMSMDFLVGFIDPLKQDTIQAVETASQAGIKVVMITGDHPATALAIAKKLGIAESNREVVTGQELAEISDVQVPEFFERVKHSTVFARVSPDQKLQIVDALMLLGNFVAVTGDGVNDAPALRKANIGVAMGSGTDVAKDTASLIVTDDSMASIVSGVEEGRHAYANVRKVTLLLISTGLAELVLIGLAIAAGLPIPLLAVQILWLNLITNGIQDVALAFEAGEKGVMNLPPRPPSEGLFNRKMIEQVLISGLTMALICFGAWYWLIEIAEWEIGAARSGLLTLLVLMQFYHVLNCRSENTSIFKIPFRNNPVLIAGMVLAFVIHLLATNIPVLQNLLRTETLVLNKWLIFAALGMVITLVVELYKWISRRRESLTA